MLNVEVISGSKRWVMVIYMQRREEKRRVKNEMMIMMRKEIRLFC